MDYRQHKSLDIPSGGMYLHSPDLSQFGDCQSTSGGSTESFQTQVPLPYYLPSRDEQQRPNTAQHIATQWDTPNLQGYSAMETFHNSAKALNPASSPYVPSHHFSLSSSHAQSQVHFEHANVHGQQGSFSSLSSMIEPSQQGGQIGQIGQLGQIGHMSSYGNGQPYALPSNMLGAQTGGGLPPHFQQPQYGTTTPYGQYAPPVEQFTTYNSGYNMNNANSAAHFTPICPPMNTAQNFHGMPGPSGVVSSGASQPWAGANFSGAGMHNTQGMGFTGAPYNGHKQDNNFNTCPTTPYSFQNQRSSRLNTRDNSSASLHSKQSTITRGQIQYSGPDTAKKFERRGSIHTPLRNSALRAQTPSPLTTVKKSMSLSNTRHPRRVDNEDAKPRLNLTSTPDSRPNPLGMEFISEPRRLEGPAMRSRRGHTLSSVDPANKNAVFDWLQSTPSAEAFTSRDKSDGRRRASPPKMMNLLAAGSVTPSNLKTINEDDPFVYGPSDLQEKSAANPFAPMQAVVSYNNNSLGLGPAGHNSAMSVQLRNLTSNGARKPTIAEAVDPKNVPFSEICRLARDDNWGVVKIKNIPYSVNRPEVLAFLGRNAKIVAEYDSEPIHIIMERVTSKTLDCYVEFVSFNEAVAAVNRFETNRTGGHSGRLGQRHVEVELSSQEHLMKDLFPKAKNVKWNGSRPIIRSTNGSDRFTSGFQGFVSREELIMLVKHVESPQRSPFSKDCPQRPFECLISTLLKYPWYMVDHITIEERNLLHKATIDLLSLLLERINNDKDDICLTPMLLKRVWKAALKCHGFTPAMKDDIVFICQIDAQTAVECGVAPYAPYWKYLWTIGPKPGVPADLLLWYIAIIRETTEKCQLSLAERAALGHTSDEAKLFGQLDKHLNFPEHFHQMTLAEVARIEWTVIEMILRQALG